MNVIIVSHYHFWTLSFLDVVIFGPYHIFSHFMLSLIDVVLLYSQIFAFLVVKLGYHSMLSFLDFVIFIFIFVIIFVIIICYNFPLVSF